MTSLPRRQANKKRRADSRLRCPGHLKWLRTTFKCSIDDCDGGPIEAAHLRLGTDGALGRKPSDNHAIPLCATHHRISHALGEATFQQKYAVEWAELAALLWVKSPHRPRAEAKQRRVG